MTLSVTDDKGVVHHLLVSDTIRQRILDAKGTFFANDNISQYIKPGEMELLQEELETALESVLQTLVIDTDNDHNTKETAKRVAKMYLHELYSGRYTEAPPITDFPNAKNLDEMYTLGPITFTATCSHHLVPILGQVWVGVLPGERVIGLSKFNRLTRWVMSRPHIQEEAVVILADSLEKTLKPKGLALVMKATHQCMTCRGVREDHSSSMVNAVMRGVFLTNPSAKSEFYKLIEAQGF